MHNRFIATLLVILFSVKSFGFVLVIDDHHMSGDEVHGYYHTIGQPHSHDEPVDNDAAESSFTISYSDDAIDHSNENQDRASFFVFEVSQIAPPNSVPDNIIPTRPRNWDTPFIEYSPPPPKA